MYRNYVVKIIKIIKEIDWNVSNIWVENNRIYADVKNKNGNIEEEILYAGSDLDLNDVYNMFNRLKYILNSNNMLNDDNIMI